jgi:hypothetical protein
MMRRGGLARQSLGTQRQLQPRFKKAFAMKTNFFPASFRTTGISMIFIDGRDPFGHGFIAK